MPTITADGYTISDALFEAGHGTGTHFHAANEVANQDPPSLPIGGYAEAGGFFGDENPKGLCDFDISGLPSAEAATARMDVADVSGFTIPSPGGMFGQDAYVGTMEVYGYPSDGVEELAKYSAGPETLLHSFSCSGLIQGETIEFDVTDFWNARVLAGDTHLGLRIQVSPVDPDADALTFENFEIEYEEAESASGDAPTGPSTFQLPEGIPSVWTPGVFEDFQFMTDGKLWTVLAASTGSASVADETGGVVSIRTAASTNDDHYLKLTNEIFKIVPEKPLIAEARIYYAGAGSIVFGLFQEAALDLITDAGSLATTLDGVGFYKQRAEEVWRTISSNGLAQKISKTEQVAGAASWQTLSIQVEPINELEAFVTYWFDPAGGQNLRQCWSNARPPAVKHNLNMALLGEMHIVFGVKAASDDVDTLKVDYLSVWQKR